MGSPVAHLVNSVSDDLDHKINNEEEDFVNQERTTINKVVWGIVNIIWADTIDLDSYMTAAAHVRKPKGVAAEYVPKIWGIDKE